MKCIKVLLLNLLLLSSVVSCDVPEIEPEDIELDEIRTALPLGHVTFDNIEEFVKLEDYSSAIPTIDVALTNGITTPQGLVVPIPRREAEIFLSLDKDPTFSLAEVVLKSGTISFEFRFNIPCQATLLLELPNILDASGNPFRKEVVLPKNQNYLNNPFVVSANVAGFKINPVANKLTVVTSGSVLVVAGDVIKNVVIQPTLKLRSLDFSSIKGYFGQKEFSINPEVIPVEDQLPSSVSIGNSGSILKIAIENSFGVPFEVDLRQVKAIRKDNSTVDLVYRGSTLVKAGEVTGNKVQTVPTYLELNSSNSNISSFFTSDIKEISFGADVLANPQPGGPASNFISDEGKIKVSLGVLLPLKVTPGA